MFLKNYVTRFCKKSYKGIHSWSIEPYEPYETVKLQCLQLKAHAELIWRVDSRSLIKNIANNFRNNWSHTNALKDFSEKGNKLHAASLQKLLWLSVLKVLKLIWSFIWRSFEALSIISEKVSVQYLFKHSHTRRSPLTSQHLCLSMVQVSFET